MKHLFQHQDLRPRWASPENPAGEAGAAHRGNDGRKRRASFPLPAGGQAVLAQAEGGPGTVRRIWITIHERSPASLRGLRIRMTWDDAAAPSVDVPLGDFFCHGAGRMTTFENEFFSSPEGRSFVSIVPMPFHSAMRIELINDSAIDQSMVFYDVDYTLGDRHGPDMLYFHAHWRRESPTTLGTDFTLLPSITGHGRFLGALLSVLPDAARWGQSWWGEGEMKVYLDGDGANPTLCGTGTEDWIGTAWGQGQFVNRYQGCPIADKEGGCFAFYRFHVPDPLFFQHGIRIEMQQIGWANAGHLAVMKQLGTTLRHGDRPLDIDGLLSAGTNPIFERSDDWASCSWFYLDRPVSGLPELAPVAERLTP